MWPGSSRLARRAVRAASAGFAAQLVDEPLDVLDRGVPVAWCAAARVGDGPLVAGAVVTPAAGPEERQEVPVELLQLGAGGCLSRGQDDRGLPDSFGEGVGEVLDVLDRGELPAVGLRRSIRCCI